ncbi:helix-turn-helix domain-containing protein, partial [Marinobacter sp. TBZ242]
MVRMISAWARLSHFARGKMGTAWQRAEEEGAGHLVRHRWSHLQEPPRWGTLLAFPHSQDRGPSMTDVTETETLQSPRQGGESNGATRERNEREILEAAERVFAQYGYRGASVQAIAEEAGLPKSNVLYYMGNKRGLYVRLLERMRARWSALLGDI